MQGNAPGEVKSAVLSKLQGSLPRMAQLPAPSRLLESMYLQAGLHDKELIAASLAKSVRALQVHLFRCCLPMHDINTLLYMRGVTLARICPPDSVGIQPQHC